MTSKRSAGADGLTVTVLRSWRAFLAIETEWHELFVAAAHPTPFLRHRWLRLSWELGSRRFPNRLRVILVHQHGQLVMAGAFVLGMRRLKPQFEFLASGTPQYHDVLWRPSDSTERQADLLLEALLVETTLQAKLATRYLRDISPFRPAMRSAGLEQRVQHEWPCPYIALDEHADFTGYLGSLSANLRNDHLRRLRRFAETGVTYGHETGDDAREVVQWCFDSKRNWLDRTGQEADWLRNGHVDRFFKAFIEQGADGAETWVASLRRDGRVIAASLVFIERDAAFYSKITHDPEFASFSPGRTLTLLLIESAFRRGLAEFDLGVGALDWKQRLQPTMRTSSIESIRLK
jgi:CelD/BcsL family acetyltransferase involved in cellulose biosynthesis